MVKVRADTLVTHSARPILCLWIHVCSFGSFSGGLIALYALLCRNAKFCLLPNHQAADEEISTYRYPGRSNTNRPTSPLKGFIERHKSAQTCLLLLVLFGASMVICVGILTPAISGELSLFNPFDPLKYCSGICTY